jgi:hypothetical protein
MYILYSLLKDKSQLFNFFPSSPSFNSLIYIKKVEYFFAFSLYYRFPRTFTYLFIFFIILITVHLLPFLINFSFL